MPGFKVSKFHSIDATYYGRENNNTKSVSVLVICSFADDVAEASDGSVYFSDASSKFGLPDWFLDLLEARPHGRLLRYDPSTKKTSVVLANLTFANGVTLSQGQDFLVVCETWK